MQSSENSADSTAEVAQDRRYFSGPHLSPALGSLVFVLVGSWSAWEGKSLGLFMLGSPAPGLFPFVFGAMLAVIALISLGVDIARYRRMVRSIPVETVLEESEPGGPRRVVGYLAVGVGCAVTMNWIGFIPAALAGMLVLVRFVERLSWRTSLLIAVGSAIFAELLFVRLLAVPLPAMPF